MVWGVHGHGVPHGTVEFEPKVDLSMGYENHLKFKGKSVAWGAHGPRVPHGTAEVEPKVDLSMWYENHCKFTGK